MERRDDSLKYVNANIAEGAEKRWRITMGMSLQAILSSVTNIIRRPIASAVILPEPPRSPRQKRRQSSASDSTSKRPRFSHDPNSGSPVPLRDSPQPIHNSKDAPQEKARDSNHDRRKSSVQEERKRGQRLFGGLLSTLSQSTPNGQQKRRLEIEKRQQEKAKQQKAADEEKRAEKLAKLRAIRKAEQIKFDEESVSITLQEVNGYILTSVTDADTAFQLTGNGKFPAHENRTATGMVSSYPLLSSRYTDYFSTISHGNYFQNKKTASRSRSSTPKIS